jgi:hypothetical protein
MSAHLKNTPPVKTEFRSYNWLSNHPGDKFNPFDPDPAGALREVYTWITQPEMMTPTHATYRVVHYNQLTEMLRRAIKNAEGGGS